MIALNFVLLALPAILSLAKAQIVVVPTNMSRLHIGEILSSTAILHYYLPLPNEDLDEWCFYSIIQPLTRYAWDPPAAPSNSSAPAASNNSSAPTNSSTAATSSATSNDFGGSAFGGPGRLSKRQSSGASQKLPVPVCEFPSAVISVYASMYAYCTPAEIQAGIPYWHEACGYLNTTLMDLTQVQASINSTSIAHLPQIDGYVNTTGNTAPMSSPVVMSQRFYGQSYKSFMTQYYQKAKDNHYGFALMGYWGFVMAAGMVVRFYKFISTETSSAQASIKSKRSVISQPGMFSNLRHNIRTNIVMPAAFAPFNTHHQRLFFWHTIPKRLDLIIVLGYVVLSVVLLLINYTTFDNNVAVRTVPMQYWWYIADRSGILVVSMLAWIWVFGGRNNIFLWATPFSVQSMNMFHRFTAWTASILGIVHAVASTVLFQVYLKIYSSNVKENYIIMGIIALSCMCIMCVSATAWFRRNFYEPFLNMHIILGVLLLYGLWRHSIKNGAYDTYNYPIWAIWSFDRAVRIARVIYCNVNMRWNDRIMKSTHSIVKYDQASDMLLIQVYNTAKTLKPGPGQYYHIYQPFTMTGWENHPFTLGAYTEAPENKKQLTWDEKHDQLYDPAGKKLTFYVRPYDGWTKRLKNQCLRSGVGEINPKLLVEGPYGHTEPLYAYDNVLMIVGGTGVASAVPYILDHIKRASAANPTTRTTRIHLVWSVRQEAMIDAVVADSLSDALHRSDIDFSFYCSTSNATTPRTRFVDNPHTTSFTRHIEPQKVAEVTYNKDAEAYPRKGRQNLPKRPNLHIVHGPFADSETTLNELRAQMTGPFADSSRTLTETGATYSVIPRRPDIPTIIKETAWYAEESSSNLAVIMCGPDVMADTCRSTCHEIMTKGFKDIEYFEEAFGW